MFLLRPQALPFVLICLLTGTPNLLYAADVSFSRDIQPILARHCYACHGPADQEAGLAFHDRTLATTEADSGEVAIVPHDPDASTLITRITADDESIRMPPEGEPLTAQQIELLTSWIEQGAEYAPHWAFVTPERPKPPEIQHPERARNPIDQFVQAKLDAIQLAPAPAASPATLIRRVHLDLTGLLPTVEEVLAFENGELRFEEVVDRLLDSEHFGERWGRHWLDLARYADTFGYERDDVRPNAWRYRDWVIRSFNRNQPYDEFLIEQLAGDLLDEPTQDQRIAAGLHRMNIRNNEAGINKEDYRNREMVDRVNTTSTAMLGLTLGCCQCHSHKYDPFTQTDYYQLYAFFNNIELKDSEIEGSPEEQARYEKAQAALDARKKRLEARKKLLTEMLKQQSFLDWRGDDASRTEEAISLLNLTPELTAALRDPKQHTQKLADFRRSIPGRIDDTGKALRQLSVQKRHLPKPYIMTLAEATENRRDTHVLERGDFKRKGAQVQPTTPTALPPMTARGDTGDRLDLAHWLVRRDNPLTARVAVNHIWTHLFGRGIVTSPDDFGTQGEPPTHPKLLDWLAVEFMESGWDRRQLIRTIVHSTTYQQSSQFRTSDNPKHQLAYDSSNPLFARQSRFRVEAEIVRDLFLDASGLLHHQTGGPTVHPDLPAAVSDLGYKYKTRWIVSDKPQRYRRGLYIHFKRTNPYPTLLMFDGPESNICQALRNRSNTPLQALATLNDPVFVECAQALGQTLASRQAAEESRIDTLCRRCLTRSPEPRETQALLQLLQSQRLWYQQNPQEAEQLTGDYVREGVALHESAAWIAVARTVLNLDEFVTRE